MTEAQMDMSLDDIIKSTPKVKRGRGGRGAAAAGGEGRRGRGASRGAGGRGRGASRGGNRTPYSRETPQGKWRHDRYGNSDTAEQAAPLRSRGGGGGAAPIKLLISNLEYSVNDQDIRELFSEFGTLKSYSVHYDRSGRSLGTADVVYMYRADATRAVKTYNDVPLDGKPMRIELVADEAPVAPLRTNSFGGRGGGRGGRFNSGMRSGGGGGGGARGGRPSGGRGGARGGRGGRGGGAEKKKPMTAEELDAQLDDYKKKD